MNPLITLIGKTSSETIVEKEQIGANDQPWQAVGAPAELHS
jgi:hypothetical protein